MMRRTSLSLALILLALLAAAGDSQPAIITDDPPASTWKQVTFKPVSDSKSEKFRYYVEMVRDQFKRQRTAVIDRSGLREIILVDALAVDGQPRAAVPDYPLGRIYLDPSVGNWSGQYQRHLIHHEFFHFIMGKWKDDAYFKDPDWIALNAEGAKYGNGGVNARTSDMFELNYPDAGFINRYSQSAVEEDMAEMFAVFFVPEELKQVETWAQEDDVLRRKLRYMRGLIDRFAEDRAKPAATRRDP